MSHALIAPDNDCKRRIFCEAIINSSLKSEHKNRRSQDLGDG